MKRTSAPEAPEAAGAADPSTAAAVDTSPAPRPPPGRCRRPYWRPDPEELEQEAAAAGWGRKRRLLREAAWLAAERDRDPKAFAAAQKEAAKAAAFEADDLAARRSAAVRLFEATAKDPITEARKARLLSTIQPTARGPAPKGKP